MFVDYKLFVGVRELETERVTPTSIEYIQLNVCKVLLHQARSFTTTFFIYLEDFQK